MIKLLLLLLSRVHTVATNLREIIEFEHHPSKHCSKFCPHYEKHHYWGKLHHSLNCLSTNIIIMSSLAKGVANNM